MVKECDLAAVVCHFTYTRPIMFSFVVNSYCSRSNGVYVFLIVGNYGGSTGVYVFQPSGEHVASLSLARSGGIQFPAGIAIDEDGFVYVCDHNFTIITVF